MFCSLLKLIKVFTIFTATLQSNNTIYVNDQNKTVALTYEMNVPRYDVHHKHTFVLNQSYNHCFHPIRTISQSTNIKPSTSIIEIKGSKHNPTTHNDKRFPSTKLLRDFYLYHYHPSSHHMRHHIHKMKCIEYDDEDDD